METLASFPEKPPVYQPIALELGEADIQTAMQAYLAFLALPESEREKIAYFDPARPRTGQSGYMHKETADIKHVFHMTQDLANSLMDEYWRLPHESREFVRIAGEIYDSLAISARAKYQELEAEIPALVGIHFPRSGQYKHHLRFLSYQDNREGILAQGHYDKATGTIAVAESHGGLKVGYGLEDAQLIDRSSYDPLFFLGYGWHQLAEIIDSVPSHRAAWHEVVDTGERFSEDTLRWAMIFFINPANLYLETTQEQTHTPIPWRDLGQQALQSDGKSFLV